MENPDASGKARVFEKIDSGDARGAVNLTRKLLSEDADNPDLLGLLGLALEGAGDIDAGADALRRALSRPTDPSIRLRNASNLAAMLFDAGRSDEVVDLLRQGWRWPEDKAPEAKVRDCITLLARFKDHFELWEELAAFLLPIVQAAHHDLEILKYLARALAELGRTGEALRLVEKDRLAGAEEYARQAILAYLYSKAGQVETMRAARSAYLSGAPSYITPAQPGQGFTIGVINPQPAIGTLLKPAHIQHFGVNLPAVMARKLAHRYRFASVLFGSGPEAVETFRGYQPRVVINNVVGSEFLTSFDHLDRTRAFIETIGAPVINPPEHAARCSRQTNSVRLARVPGLVVPRVLCFNRNPKRIDGLVGAIEGHFDYPVIVRTISDHEAKDMTLVHAREALREALLRLEQTQIYVLQYAGAPRRDGYYRRIRAAFVEGVPIIVRADYTNEWIVRSRNKIPLEIYRGRPDLLADADDIIRRPGERLGAAAMETLNEVGRLLQLDIFGMDFDLDDEGCVVLFEANASMNYLSNAPPEVPYPPEAEAAFLAHLDRLFERRASV